MHWIEKLTKIEKTVTMYEKKCKENQELEKRIEFLLGAIEAYKFCIENKR